MMRNMMKAQQLAANIRKDGATIDNLKAMVITLADVVIELQREIDRVNAVASRADRQSRLGIR